MLIPRPLLRLLLATRPAFLSVTVVAVLLGLACSWHEAGHIDLLLAAMTLLLALFAHAGANVVNDFHDIDTDALNTERIYPFTGGSRFIQNGILSRRYTGLLGYLLLASVIPAGLWLVTRAGAGLLVIGIVGLLAAWSYSAQPLRLAARGFGEVAIVAGWSLVVIGTAYVQGTGMSSAAVVIGVAYGLMVASLLYINQFPDAGADAIAGKRTWVVRLGRHRAVPGYALIVLGANAVIVAAALAALLSVWILLALFSLPLSVAAYRQLQSHAAEPSRLEPAIKLTILSTHLFGVLLAAALLLA